MIPEGKYWNQDEVSPDHDLNLAIVTIVAFEKLHEKSWKFHFCGSGFVFSTVGKEATIITATHVVQKALEYQNRIQSHSTTPKVFLPKAKYALDPRKIGVIK